MVFRVSGRMAGNGSRLLKSLANVGGFRVLEADATGMTVEIDDDEADVMEDIAGALGFRCEATDDDPSSTKMPKWTHGAPRADQKREKGNFKGKLRFRP